MKNQEREKNKNIPNLFIIIYLQSNFLSFSLFSRKNKKNKNRDSNHTSQSELEY